MRVLMHSLDPNILKPEHGTAKRMVEYSGLVDELTIVLFSSGGPKQVHGRLTIHPTSSFKPLSFFMGWWISFRELRKKQYDLITLQEPFILSLVSFPLAWIFNLPLEVQVHSTFFSPYWKESLKNTLYQFLARMFVPHATCIRAVSERIKKDLTDGLGASASKITVLPVFVDTKHIADAAPAFDLKKKYPQFDFIILTASRLVRQKNIELAITALKKIVSKHPRTGLVIVGAGPHEGYLRGKSKGFEKNIAFEGWADDIVSYYKGADVFVLSSNYEGWAMAVIEAMAAGTPVVMTDVGCAGEVVRNDENGIVVPIEDYNALAQAIERLHDDPAERERLARAGRETIQNLEPRTKKEYLAQYKQSWERCVEVYENKKR